MIKVSSHDEIRIKKVRDVGKDENIGKKDATEFTKKLGLNSGRADEEMKDADKEEDDTERITVEGNAKLQSWCKHIHPWKSGLPGDSFFQQLCCWTTYGIGTYRNFTSCMSKETLKSILEDIEDEDEDYYEGEWGYCWIHELWQWSKGRWRNLVGRS